MAIGHANPSAKLDVIGTTELNGNLTVQNASVFVKGGNLAVFNNTQSATPLFASLGLNKVLLGRKKIDVSGVSTNVTTLSVDGANSQVDIGESNRSADLNVVGTVEMTGFKLTTSPTSGHVLTSNASGVGTWLAAPSGGGGGADSDWTISGNNMSSGVTGNVGIGTTSPSAKLDVVGDTELTGAVTITGDVAINSNLNVDSGTLFVDATNNRVGFGTTSPEGALDFDRSSEGTGSRLKIGHTSPGFAHHITSYRDMVLNSNGGFFIRHNTTAGNPSTPVDLMLISTTGNVAIAGGVLIGREANIALNLTVDTDTLVVDSVNNLVGIGEASPARSLHINDVMRLEPRTDAPDSASQGDIYVDSSGALCFYDGSAWLKAAGGSSSSCS